MNPESHRQVSQYHESASSMRKHQGNNTSECLEMKDNVQGKVRCREDRARGSREANFLAFSNFATKFGLGAAA